MDKDMELLKQIQTHGGYLTYEDMKHMEGLFGKSFRICVKYYEHDRKMMKIKDYWKLSDELKQDIREVFIVAEDYSLMSDIIKDSKIMNDAKEIAKMVKECQNIRY